MWSTEHSIETTVTPNAIWRAWADVEHWPEWNADIEQIALNGPFATGSTIAMTPRAARDRPAADRRGRRREAVRR